MKTAYIIYRNYLTPDGIKMSVGGIQTYITNLIPILQEAGYCVHLYQHASKGFETVKDGVLITGFAHKGKKKDFVKYLKPIVLKKINKSNDLLIFGNETNSFEAKEYKSIAIQHGIYWDIPFKGIKNNFKFLLIFIHKVFKAWETINRVSRIRQLVCVDYNFVNWYRDITACPLIRLNVIPNFTQIPLTIPIKPEGNINIIFARRFFEFRGTRIFVEAIKPVLRSIKTVTVTMAGEGPDEDYLHNELDCFSQVSFIKYSSEDSMKIHADKHIAVIPTLGSEGTSLSLLEAMASGCAVICTNVGGMTNIVLDHYNGLMISPETGELNNALLELIGNVDLRNRIGLRAYQTVAESFSLNKWQDSWMKIIKDVETFM